MKKLIGFLLIICCIPLLSGCRWEGHRMLQKFMDDFTENNPYWWSTPDGEEKLKKAFEDSVDDYLEWCKEDGVSPEKPYSGRLNLRLAPETHKKAAINAKIKGISLNRFIEKAIEDEIMEG